MLEKILPATSVFVITLSELCILWRIELHALYKYVSQDVIVTTGFLFFLLQNIPQKKRIEKKNNNK